MHPKLTLIPLLLALASCSSPPKPPTVDESLKRPANSAMAVELLVCKIDLQNTRVAASESARVAQAATARLEHVSQTSARQPPLAAMASEPSANSVFTIRFDFGSARLNVPADTAAGLIDQARAAPLVVLRGRTDGATDATAESRIARERAAAVRDYLVSAGIDPARILATHQPTGDHTADNTSPAGRSLNRRVEIEVYRALPVVMGALGPPPAALP